MKILEKLFKNTDTQSSKIQQRVENIQSVLEQADVERKIARKEAIELALKLIEEHPNMPIENFIPTLQQDSSLTDNDIATIIKHLESEQAILAAVKSTPLPSKALASIAIEADISTETAEKIVKEIEDEDIQKEQQKRLALEREREVLNQLSHLYDTCDNIETPSLVELIEKIDIRENTKKIKKEIMSIVAKRTALDCMKFGSPRIPTLTNVVSSLDMFEYDLPYMAFKEYKNLKVKFDNNNKTYTQFTTATKKLIHDRILEDIAKTLARNYDDVGDFVVPQTEKFKHLSKEDMDKITNTVKTYSQHLDAISSKKLTKNLLNDNSDTLLENAIKSIELAIRELPESEQLKTAQAIQKTLEQRKEAIQLMNKTKLKTFPSNNEGR